VDKKFNRRQAAKHFDVRLWEVEKFEAWRASTDTLEWYWRVDRTWDFIKKRWEPYGKCSGACVLAK
jgi:hypothetical protein